MTRSFSNKIIGSMILTGLAVLVTVVGFMVTVASGADGQTHRSEEVLLAQGLADWTSNIENQIAVEANWDEALDQLGANFSRPWAEANVGRFMTETVNLERTYVLDGADRPVYGIEYGRSLSTVSSEAPALAAARDLVALVRRREQRRRIPVGRPPFDRVISEPVHVSGLKVIDGQAAIITATLVQPDFGRVATPARAPVLVTMEEMNPGFLANFSKRYLLKGLRFEPDPTAAIGDMASIDLQEADGRPAGRLVWTAAHPGRDILFKTLPAVLLGLLLLLALVIQMIRRGRRARDALVASESRARHMAFHDHLTGLPNRAMFMERLAQASAVARRSEETFAVAALDLDRFKQVNDTHGHGAGDELIVAVAGRLMQSCRQGDLVARLGGDEFAILCHNATAAGMADFCGRVTRRLAEPFDLSYGRVFVGASAGVTLVRRGEHDGAEIMRQADLAMYRAKDGGRGRHAFFEPEMDQAFRFRQALEADLREALADDALTVVYQPQVDQKGKVFGVEALVRWTHPVQGVIPPSVFVPLAEECGLIDALGRFTLRQAFTDSLKWPGLMVAVNISAVQLRTSGLPEILAELIAQTGAEPSRIELEITEGILMTDDEITHDLLARIRAMGFSLALDDFGTGYSSLSYLRRYPVDKIKIDRSFVSNLGVDDDAEAVVEAIVKLARALQLDVLGEGVETDIQRRTLLKAGCGSFQGFLYSRPIQGEAVTALLAGEARSATVA